MKKFFGGLILTGMMILLSAGIAAAEGGNGSIYLDCLVSGDGSFDAYVGSETVGPPFTLKPSQYALGGEYAFKDFVIGGEYVAGSSDATAVLGYSIPAVAFADFNYFQIHAGYRVIKKEPFQIDLGASYYNIHSSGMSEYPLLLNSFTINGLMVGTKVVCNFSEKASINIEYGTSLSASPTGDFEHLMPPGASKSGSLSAWDIKFNYLCTDDFGVAVGYRSLIANMSLDNSVSEGPKFDMASRLSGYTIGFSCQF